MKALVMALCVALLPFALAQPVKERSITAQREPDLISSLKDMVLGLCLRVLLHINNCVYRLTGGGIGVEIYCF